MKGLRLLIAIAGLVCACATTPTPAPIVTAEKCAERATHAVALTIIGDVSNGLVASNWEGELAAIVTRWGLDAVTCAVQEVAGTAFHNAQASTGDSLESLKAARGRQWLSEHR